MRPAEQSVVGTLTARKIWLFEFPGGAADKGPRADTGNFVHQLGFDREPAQCCCIGRDRQSVFVRV